KPNADRIEPIPPAVAVRQKAGVRSRRATVGTATEIYDHLRLLFARVGSIICPDCTRRVERHSPATARDVLAALEPHTRYMICFPGDGALGSEKAAPEGALAAAGFMRLIVAERTVNLADGAPRPLPSAGALVVVDRLTAGDSGGERMADSLELAFRHGGE